MLKYLLILVPGIVLFILMMLKSEYRMKLTGVFAVYVIAANVLYNFSGFPTEVSAKRTTNQLIYQEDYVESKEYADAFINLVVDGKTVYLKGDLKSGYNAYMAGFEWLYPIYYYRDPSNYMEHYAKEIIHNSGMNNSVIDKELKNDFVDIGYANDMLRNTCLYHEADNEIANYFYHYYYYTDVVGDMHVYVNPEGIMDADELVLLWQQAEKGNETCDLYLMTKDYYGRNVKVY